MTFHYLKPISPPWWIALSLCLHLALLAWCPSPIFTSPPLPTYLVVDIFSGPATSGTGNSFDDSSPGGGKTARAAKNTTKDSQNTPNHTAPQRRLESHQSQRPIKPAKIQSAAQLKPKAVKPLPEELPTPATIVKTEIAPSHVVTAKPHVDQADNTDIDQGIITSSGTNSDSISNGRFSHGSGADNFSGTGPASGPGRGGQAGSGSPVETPMTYGTNPPPPYPTTARRRGWEGEVLLLVNVTARGEVYKVTVNQSSGYQILDRAALNAIYRWEFQAAQKNGKAVPGQVMVPIRFSIKDLQ